MRDFNIDHGQGAGGAGVGGAGKAIDLTSRIAAPGFVMGFGRNEEIYGEEESADFVYRVVSGVVRTIQVLSDGRRQVAGFHYAGDVFGLEAGGTHRLCAEAVTDCRIALVRRAALERAADSDVGAARELWALTARDLQRLQDHMLLLARKGAVERLAGFLIEMTERASGAGVLDLPMSRSDIADYLGLTIETVSRSFTQLERDGVISLSGARHVELRDRAALADCAG